MYNRQFFERQEEQQLKPYAVLSRRSKGRCVKEEEDKYRTCFQRDRDRLIHSKAFRRLKHKTQVFVIYEGDHYRTRLTHTLEVAQIARQLARLLGVNEDLVEAISLAHDLGHTPFGHAGEEILNEFMNDDGGFEHNAQSRRVVEILENKYPHFQGLNLSRDIIEGLMKHQTPYDNPQKMDEADLVNPSLEAQIVNLSDQLAYINHDLDDGVAAGIIEMNELVTRSELWREAQIYNEHQYGKLNATQTRFLNVRYLINLMVMESMNHTELLIKENDIKTTDDVYRCQHPLVRYSPKFEKKVSQLQNFLHEKFYNDYRVLRMSIKGKRYIRELFNYFLKYPDHLPRDEKQRIKQEESVKRVIADYISQMTDNYAIGEYRRLFDIDIESS